MRAGWNLVVYPRVAGVDRPPWLVLGSSPSDLARRVHPRLVALGAEWAQLELRLPDGTRQPPLLPGELWEPQVASVEWLELAILDLHLAQVAYGRRRRSTSPRRP